MPYMPGKTFKGKISFIYPYLDNKNRSVEVRIEIPNKNAALKPNMYGTVTIESQLPGERLAIPDQAIIRSGTRDVVFISLGEGKFMPREIEIGATGENDMVEVVSGLSKGDVVVTSSQFMLDSESRLREATNKIRAQMASATVVKDVEGDDESEQTGGGHPEAQMKQEKIDHQKMDHEKMDHEKMDHQDSAAKKESGEKVYTCPMDSHADVVQYGPGKCPKCGMELVPADQTSGRTVYECPMPQDSVVSAVPGRCPKCGMKLVERKITHKEMKAGDKMKEKSDKPVEKESKMSGVYTCPMDSHAHIVQYGPGDCPDCGMKLVPAEETSGRTYYTCPMDSHSHVVSGEPGKCPECGMVLIEKRVEGQKND